ncbi:glyoxylate/hydroxypyruvate reductase A [Litorivicinus lipolyticus]|uniref:Glyoxylate/hydroxypyruvate reductase A n=1 Tax=Litorivicinus lipolyticus TaxID=418701 RepID=A0A5Q2QAL0_9GAMM|nr:NAD(P)-dependent oxidoreductase [Litorivicinus lipolyticus]QGG80283.1 glyoxylate/hydroxypyruvate reductase A [Litorivicinus lipolyticus]
MIPFLSTASDDEQAHWLEQLNNNTHGLTFAHPDQIDPSQPRVAVFTAPAASQLNQFPNLEWAQCTWAGVDQALSQTAVPIARLVDPGLTAIMAEAVLAWTLYLQRDMPHYQRAQRTRQWEPRPYRPPESISVAIFGAGQLGLAGAERLHQHGFDVTTLSASSAPIVPWTHITGTATPAQLARFDLIVNLIPASASTQRHYTTDFWSQCQPGLGFINFGRSAAVVDADLHQALNHGHIGHAVLDVFDHEPLDMADWKYGHEAVTVLPHISAQTPAPSAAKVIIETLRRYRLDGAVPAMVDRSRGY